MSQTQSANRKQARMEKSLGRLGTHRLLLYSLSQHSPGLLVLGFPTAIACLGGGAYKAVAEGLSINPKWNPHPSLSLPGSLNGTGNGRPTRFLA